MLHPDIQARRSRIEGTGLVARRAIPRGTVVWRPGGRDRVYTAAQVRGFSARYRRILEHYAYRNPAGRIVYLLDDARYFNHDCSPNVLPLFNRPDCEMDVAVRDIAAGEELTYEYGYLLAAGEKLDCRCGRPGCRLTIRPIRAGSPLEKRQHRLALAAGRAGRRIPQPLLPPDDAYAKIFRTAAK